MTLPLSFVIPRAAKESQREKTQAKPPRQFECFIRSMRIKCIENQQNIEKCHSEPACRFTCRRHGRQGSMTKESQKRKSPTQTVTARHEAVSKTYQKPYIKTPTAVRQYFKFTLNFMLLNSNASLGAPLGLLRMSFGSPSGLIRVNAGFFLQILKVLA
jgi:hypothetical protein